MPKNNHNNSLSSYFFLIKDFLFRNKTVFLFLILFGLQIFFRTYQLFERANFGWDQVDSAQGARQILIEHNFLLNGPVAKGNSGIYMGPLYYYMVSPFYFLTSLDPIASPMFQAFINTISFLILFFVTKKIFNTSVALMAGFINIFSFAIMTADRVQSAYYLIVTVSYLIFFSLYKIVTGNEKYILLLAVLTGFSFHVDFTSVFYPILIFFTLPFFPRTKQTLQYVLFSVPVIFIFLVPSFLNIFSVHHSQTGSFVNLFHTFYHGFHARRFFQLSHDAFISVEQILQYGFLRQLVFFVFPLFGLVYYRKNKNVNAIKLLYLIGLWVLIPWIVLSTYSGELTDYYFSLPRYVAIAALAYLTVFVFQKKHILLKVLPIFLWGVYAYSSIQLFFAASSQQGNLLKLETYVKYTIQSKEKILYKDHSSEYYMYSIYKK